MQALVTDLGAKEDLTIIDNAHKAYLEVAIAHLSLAERFASRRIQGRAYWWLDTPAIKQLITIPNELQQADETLGKCDR